MTRLGQILGEGFAIFWGLMLLIVVTWLVAMASRRVLGIQVGVMRALLVTLIATQLTSAAIAYALDHRVIPDNEYAGVLGAISIVMGLLGAFALGVLLLMVLEVIVPTGKLPPLRTMLTGWRGRFRLLGRYLAIMSVLARHGLAAQLRGVVNPNRTMAALADSLRQALNDAGVTFIKLGQMLSTRADLLPPVFIRELSTLTTRADPVDFGEVRATLHAELGERMARLRVDPKPMASASAAQVHPAMLDDDTPVVVKVQRAAAARQVELDLKILTHLARTLEANAAWARGLGVVDIVGGFTASLREELDYCSELANMEALRASLGDSEVRVPVLCEELCTSRVIVMERFDGTPVSEAADVLADMDDATRRASAERLLGAVLRQILSDGTFHSDLHAGNVLVWPDGAIGLLDYGAVGRLDSRSRRYLGLLLHSVDADDPELATDAVLELLDHRGRIDERQLQREIGVIITRFRNGLAGRSMLLFQQLLRVVLEHGMSVPAALAAALRSLGALEGTLRTLDPQIDLVESARALGDSAWGGRNMSDVGDELKKRAIRLLPLLENLPRRLNRITEDLEQGEISGKLRIIADPDDRRFLTGLVNHLVIAVLAGFAVIGAILLVTSPRGPVLFSSVRLFDLLGYLLAFAGLILALRSVAMVFGNRR